MNKPLKRGIKSHVKGETFKIRRVVIDIFPCVTTSVQIQDAHMVIIASFRHLALEGKPNKKSKKGGAKGSVAMLKDLTQMNCVSHDPHPKESILRKESQLESIHRIQFSRSTWHHTHRERKGPSLGIIQKCEPHERSPCAPKFAERSQEDTLQQERCASRVAWNPAKILFKLKKSDKATFLLSCWSKGNAGTLFTFARGGRIRG